MIVAKPLTQDEMWERLQKFHLGPPFNAWKPQLKIEPTNTDDGGGTVNGRGFWLYITIEVGDSNNGQLAAFTHAFPYFFFPDADTFDRLIVGCIRQVVLHELGESLWLGTERPLYPHRTTSAINSTLNT